MPPQIGGWGLGGRPNQSRGKLTLSQAFLASDLSGQWWIMNGDGSMAAGSNITMAPSGSPINTTQNGYPVRTYAINQNDQGSVAAAMIASSFSVGILMRRSVATSGNAQFMSFGNTVGPGTLTFTMQQASNGALTLYVSDGAAYTTCARPAGTINPSQWYFIVFTYSRIGGAANNIGTLYINGANIVSNPAMGLASGLISQWNTNGLAGGGSSQAMATRGAFTTYKVLSDSDVARISSAVL